MGNTPIKRNSHALGEQCSSSQRLVEQLNSKQAILKSPPIVQSDFVDMKHLPEEYMSAIHENGLYDKYLTMQSMSISLPKTGNKIEHLLNWISRHGVLPGVQTQWKSIHVK